MNNVSLVDVVLDEDEFKVLALRHVQHSLRGSSHIVYADKDDNLYILRTQLRDDSFRYFYSGLKIEFKKKEILD